MNRPCPRHGLQSCQIRSLGVVKTGHTNTASSRPEVGKETTLGYCDRGGFVEQRLNTLLLGYHTRVVEQQR